ncbi:MAG: acyl-homoserine-lactone synthase [Hyphomicrobiales bacterium]
MFLQITPDMYSVYERQIEEMFDLRHRVFCGRLGWVKNLSGSDRDHFDDCDPTYVVKLASNRKVVAAARLLPTVGPNMLRDVFPELVQFDHMPQADNIWECSRFAVDTEYMMRNCGYEASSVAVQLFASLVEFGLSIGLSKIVSVSESRIERIIRRSRWPVERLGDPQIIGSTRAVALSGEVSEFALHSIMNKAGGQEPLLFQPVVQKRLAGYL